uniref:Uncharacterized protein n=1 Tax=Romanomermis culicivorax TaxID=13658 RepID=A0A915I931_ROMCU
MIVQLLHSIFVTGIILQKNGHLTKNKIKQVDLSDFQEGANLKRKDAKFPAIYVINFVNIVVSFVHFPSNPMAIQIGTNSVDNFGTKLKFAPLYNSMPINSAPMLLP